MLPLRGAASPPSGRRVRHGTARTGRFAMFSSRLGKYSLLDASHRVHRKGTIPSGNETVSVVLKARISRVPVRRESWMHRDSMRCLFDNKMPNQRKEKQDQCVMLYGLQFQKSNALRLNRGRGSPKLSYLIPCEMHCACCAQLAIAQYFKPVHNHSQHLRSKDTLIL